MSDVSDVKKAIDRALQSASQCNANETSENYAVLEDQIEALEGLSRRLILSKVDVATLLPKLEKARPLTPADLKTLELLIVGDAESYLKYETELEQWKQESKRILGEIASLESADLDVDALMHLRALCSEARRVLPPLVQYFDQKERAARFQTATQGPIHPEGYRVLAEIIRKMIES